MPKRPLILIENKIPFIKGRLEQIADVRYLAPDDFNPTTIAQADALIVRTRTKCDATLLDNSKVKFIATATIGTDHIDTQWCNSHGIMVKNAPGCNAPAVAQYVWASILHLDIDPRQITIGIVGHGNVGTIVAEWGRRLGAKVLLCDPPKATSDTDNADKYLSLEKMLPQCDIVTLHTPLTKNGDHPTHHLIGSPQLSLMRQGAVLINAARGAVVDTSALLEYADTKHLKLVIDCWEGEPLISTELLKKAIIATPHIAGYSLEGKQRATRMVVEATFDYFNNRHLIADTSTANAPVSEQVTLSPEIATIKISVDDLTAKYTLADISLSPEATALRIAQSYNPTSDTDTLKSAVVSPDTASLVTASTGITLKVPKKSETSNTLAETFEQLRADYTYRHEPSL